MVSGVPWSMAARIHQVAAYAKGACAGAEEAFRGLQGDTACGNELEEQERREQGLEITSAAHGGAGKDLNAVGAGIPGSGDFRWRERTGNGDIAKGTRPVHDFRMEAGADHELRAGVDGGFGLLCGGDGARAEYQLARILAL